MNTITSSELVAQVAEINFECSKEHIFEVLYFLAFRANFKSIQQIFTSLLESIFNRRRLLPTLTSKAICFLAVDLDLSSEMLPLYRLN